MSSEPDNVADVTGQVLMARELRRHRERVGLSLSELAGRVGYSRTYISASEKPGGGLVSEAVVRRIDHELDAQGALIDVWVRADTERRTRRNPPDVMARRPEFDTDPTKQIMAASVEGGPRAPSVRYVDPALVGYFEAQLSGHYSADALLGARVLIDTVSAQLELILDLIECADGSTRQKIVKVGSSVAALIAWLRLDAGDFGAALTMHELALELAHRSGDRESVACALVDRAMALTDLGKGAAVVDLCGSVLAEARYLSPEIQVFALQQEAHGASLLGDRSRVDTLLDRAGPLVDQVDVEVWGTACRRTAGYVEVQRATCYGRLGLAAESDHLWNQILPLAPASARRDVGVWSARHSVACLGMGEPERAVGLARHAAEIAVETGSARARQELAAVSVAMLPWRRDDVGRDLAEVLAPALNFDTRGDS